MKKKFYIYVLLVAFIFLNLLFAFKVIAYSINELEDIKNLYKKNAEIIYENINKTDDPSEEDIKQLEYINDQLIIINKQIDNLNQEKRYEIHRHPLQNDIKKQTKKSEKKKNSLFTKFIYLSIFLFFLYHFIQYLNNSTSRNTNNRNNRTNQRQLNQNRTNNSNNNINSRNTIPVRMVPRTTQNNQLNQNNRNIEVHHRHNTIIDSNGARKDSTFVSSNTDGRVPLDLT